MITDNLLQYSAAQALTATAASTNVIDHSSDRDIGIGERMAVVFTVDALLAGTSPTFSAAIQVSSAVGFGTPVTVISTGTYTALAAGARIVLPIPPDTTFDRYSRVNYTLGGTSPTVSVTANLIPAEFVQADQYGPAAFTVQ